MPTATRSRPDSISTIPSAEPHPGATASLGLSYPQSNEIVTPSTLGESSLFSQGTGAADLSSPFTSEGSRQSSMTSEGHEVKRLVPVDSAIQPGREGSKDSKETIHADLGAPIVEAH